jgi:hypothetical protein
MREYKVLVVVNCLVALICIGCSSKPEPPKTTQKTVHSIGKVLSLYGQGDYVDVPEKPTLQVSDSMTMEAWVRFFSLNSRTPYVLYKRFGYGFAPNNSRGIYWFFYKDSNDFVEKHISLSTPLLDNRWYHIGVTLSPEGAVKTYLDGQLIDTDSINVPINSTGVLRIGMSPYTEGEFFNGFLDEIRIWNIPRTAEEIQATMNLRLTGKERGLVGYWNFDDDTANDKSPHGNHGILMGNSRITEPSLVGRYGDE